MDNAQFAALISALVAGLGGIGAAIKWVGGRITKSIDDNSKAMIDNTASNAVLATKIDTIAKFVHESTPIRGVPITAGGYGPGRPPTHGNGR